MSQHSGAKGKNATAKHRKKPTSSDIARNIEYKRRTACLRSIMSKIVSPTTEKKDTDEATEVTP